jgi:ankyrin repeat protein
MELGDLRQAEKWLDAGMPPDYMGSRTGSGLMIGAWEGKIELMRLFVSRGADINKLNANGESAIALAAWRGQLEAVKWLLERGARINAAARQWSALHYAVFAGHAEVANYLIEQGADINAQTTNGSSVLMMAVYEGHRDLAHKLIEKGADRTPKNDWGDGALEWAMRQNWSSATWRRKPSTNASPPSACASCVASSTAPRRPVLQLWKSPPAATSRRISRPISSMTPAARRWVSKCRPPLSPASRKCRPRAR